jgi:predicted DNA-binding protein (MmcQ/YjbR family)
MAHPLTAPLRDFAFGLPEAWEDHPWEESVAKVGKKVFVFFGMPESDELRFTVKLPRSSDEALAMPWSAVPGYGLERGHWVTLAPPSDAPLDLLTAWVEESYCTVASKRLAALFHSGAG